MKNGVTSLKIMPLTVRKSMNLCAPQRGVNKSKRNEEKYKFELFFQKYF